jgi:hypothetical protein
VKYISLTQGKETIVDDDDFGWISRWKWQFNRGYAKRDIKCIRMHREIIHATKGMDVDHINGNKLDNRKCNLRLVNDFQQNQNSNKRKDNTSGCRGVNFFKPRGTWIARIQYNGKRIGLGTYHDKADAIKAYNEASNKYFGEYARHTP